MADWFTPSYGSASLWGPDQSVRFNASRNAATDMANQQWYSSAYQGAMDEARERYREESDREYQLRAQSIKQQAEQIAISRGQAEANKWYQRQMVELSKQKLQEEQRQFNINTSGYMEDGRPTFAREQFSDSSLRDWAQFAASLKGPEDWVRYKAMTSGIANNADSIPGLAWTRGGQVGNTTFSGTPQVMSIQKLLGDIGAGGGWAGQAAQQAASGTAGMTPQEAQLYQTADAFARNPHQSAPGWLESQDPTTLAMLKGAAEAAGHDWASALARYKRSQWGTPGSAMAA